ncbi:DUF983 domain-containing protein [Sphingomonas baiyangensis]|uniref:DUF983 domain-containing protein n=1 Tax=Sphingomonas baiyangensis TaxID=2572576 RepID=A0A4U1L2F1_9SPHN|nr:DUF983 domain-containing protein [Sphingomonas baiyangensis]TKD50390.1 DUF983 domain-containing protein [Sphingomonas baiyangensis]
MSVPPDQENAAGVAGDQPPAAPVSLYLQSVRGLCPRCHEPTLFRSTIAFASRCRACGLDFDSFNVGDGPAAFLTLGIGTIVTILAIIVELAFEPAWWVHVALWLPLTVASVIGCLRLTKGALLALEYRNAAREGRRQ